MLLNIYLKVCKIMGKFVILLNTKIWKEEVIIR